MNNCFKILILLCSIPFFASHQVSGQNENPWTSPPKLNVAGFVDAYYAWDFNKPTTPNRQPFFYNHNTHNEFNLNIGMIALSVEQTKYRAKIALQAGTYANDNYSAEAGVLKNIYEGYAGISLNKKNNLWLDAGIFLSHLGVESPVSIDNWTLTRSIAIENLPYFLSGARITYNPNDVIQILGVVCNGWQHIDRIPGNSLPGFGTQLLITPNKKFTFSWGTFISSEDPDTTRRMRYFNDFYAVMQFTEKFGLSAGMDFGVQQKAKGSSAYDSWYTFTLIAQYKFAKKWATALRGEYYSDKEGVIVTIENPPYNFNTTGLSWNIDFIPIPNIACRIEARYLHDANEIYIKDNLPTHSDFFIVGSIAIKFDKDIL